MRGEEAYDLLQALNTGHAGTLCTIHASSATQALARLTSCVLQAGVDVPYRAVRHQIGEAVQMVVHMDRRHGARVVDELITVHGYDPDRDVYDTTTLAA